MEVAFAALTVWFTMRLYAQAHLTPKISRLFLWILGLKYVVQNKD